jgi:hypothetical protein
VSVFGPASIAQRLIFAAAAAAAAAPKVIIQGYWLFNNMTVHYFQEVECLQLYFICTPFSSK